MDEWSAAEASGLHGPLSLSRAATALLDSDNTVMGWSRAAENLLGYPAHEIVGRRLDELLVGRPEEEPTATELLRQAAPEESSTEARIARHRDGSTLQVAVTTSPLPGIEGSKHLVAVTGMAGLQTWETHQSMLRGLATQSPIGLGVYHKNLRLTWVNATYQREVGLPFGEYSGKRVNELYGNGQVLSENMPDDLETVMRSVLDTGDPVFGLLFRARPPTDPQHDHVWSCAYYRLQDAQGRVLGVCEDALDITDRYRAEQRLALTVRAGVRIGATLDMPTAAEEITEVVIPAFADAVTVDLAEGVLEGEEPSARAHRVPPLMRLIDRSGTDRGDGEEHTVPEPYAVQYPPESPQAISLSAGEAVNAHDGPFLGPCPAGDGAHSVLAVPLRARGAVMGLVTFLRCRNPDSFDNDEVTLANELVTRTALSIDNARRYTRERSAALTLQQNLLPRGLPQQSAVEVAHRYLPSDIELGVGGDWFDVLALSGTRVGLVVGDVVGHGVNAAATMGRLRTTVRALAAMDLAPDELLTHLNELVLRGIEEEPDPADGEEALGVACLYVVYDPVSRVCTAARAGHPPPACIDPDGTFSLLDIPAGPPLGVGGLPYELLETTLAEGSLLALFTGGLIENRDRDIDSGLAALKDVLTDGQGSLEDLCDRTLAALQPEGPTTEDAALLLARTRALDSHHVAGWELRSEPSAVGTARSLVTGQLAEWGLEGLAFSTELVVSELVTNAVRHAAGPLYLRLIRDRALHCEVWDGGHTSPNLRRSAYDDEGGRGLFIVAQMVQRWGTRYTAHGKTLWTEQPLPGDA